MRNFPLHGRINFRLLPFIKKVRQHVIKQELLMFGVDRTQAVMVNQLVLRGQPGFPAARTDLFKDPFAERIAKWRAFQRGQVLSATCALNGRHKNLSSSSVSVCQLFSADKVRLQKLPEPAVLTTE